MIFKTFFQYIKNIFSKKNLEKIEIIKIKKIQQKLPKISKIKVDKQKEVQGIKETPQIKEVSKEQKQKDKFQRELDYLTNHKAEIIQDKKERELKFVENGIVLDKKAFIFDKEGMKFFNEEFNLPEYELFVSYAKESYYLCRRNKETGSESSFHRLFMSREITEFCIKNNCESKDVEVHHKTCSGDNSKENLEVLTIEEHRRRHGQ